MNSTKPKIVFTQRSPEPIDSRFAGALGSIGSVSLGNKRILGFLCSIKCPGDLILRTYDAIRSLRDDGAVIAGGFHSPMEKESLDLLLRGTQPVVICLARSVERMRVPAEWRGPVDEGRLLILSPFDSNVRRITKETAQRRNEFIATISDELFIPHATPGGEVEALCRKVQTSGMKVITFASEVNQGLIALGAGTSDLKSYVSRYK